MTSDEDRSRLNAQRSALKQYLGSGAKERFELERGECHSMDAVICPSALSRLRISLQFILLWLAQITPMCSMKPFLYRLAGVRVGKCVCISPGVVMDPLFPSLIELEDGCILGMGCRLLTHEFTATEFRVGPVRVGSGSVIGGWSTVRCGVTVGEKVTVGANSFVNRDVPDGLTVAGVPAKPLGRGGEAE